MRPDDRWAVCGGLLAWALACPVVEAQGTGAEPAPADAPTDIDTGTYPARYIDRSVVIPRGFVRVDGRYQDAVSGFGRVGPLEAIQRHSLGLGFAVGITDRVEVGITHGRAPDIDGIVGTGAGFAWTKGDPAARGVDVMDVDARVRVRLVSGDELDLGLELGMRAPIDETSRYEVRAMVPARARLAPRFALDLAPGFACTVDAGPPPGEDAVETFLAVPVAGVLTLAERAFVAVRSGMVWHLTNDAGLFDGFFFPLFVELGGTVGSPGRVLVDLSVEVGTPFFLLPGASDPLAEDPLVARVKLAAAFDVAP